MIMVSSFVIEYFKRNEDDKTAKYRLHTSARKMSSFFFLLFE